MENVFNEYALDKEDGDDYVEWLLDRETMLASIQERQYSSQIMNSNWIKEARLDAIQYILNKRVSFGFKFQTAYLSVTYMDRFLSTRSVEGEKYWAVKLLAMACLSLAAKMEECIVPPLPEFPTEDYNFESRLMEKMELLVLSTLDWKMKSITPFAFVQYFESKLFNDSVSEDISSRIVDVVLDAIRDVNLMSYRPSVIAAGATIITLDPRLTREALELKLNCLSSSQSLNIQDVWHCYNQLKHIERLESAEIVSPPFSPIELQKIKKAETSSSTLASGNKRKRLGFDDCDPDSDKPNPKQHG